MDAILKTIPDNVEWFLDEEYLRRKNKPQQSKNWRKIDAFQKLRKGDLTGTSGVVKSKAAKRNKCIAGKLSKFDWSTRRNL